MHLPLPIFFDLVLGLDHMLGQRVADNERAGLINLILGGVRHFAGKMPLQLAGDGLFQRILGVQVLWHGISCLLT